MNDFKIKIIGNSNDCSCASNKQPLYLWRHSTAPPSTNYIWVTDNYVLFHNGYDWITIESQVDDSIIVEVLGEEQNPSIPPSNSAPQNPPTIITGCDLVPDDDIEYPEVYS